MEPWSNLWADLSQGMANLQMEPWSNLWADLSQGTADSQMEPWNNLWTDNEAKACSVGLAMPCFWSERS